MPTRLRQSGFSLIELLLALGIGVLVMAAVYAAYDGRRTDAEVAVLDADLDALVQKADMAYASSGQYAVIAGSAVPVNAQRLNDVAGGLPSAFIPDASMSSGYRTFWGGQATVGAASTNGGVTLDLLTVTLAGIPSTACLDLVGRMAPRMYDTRVNGTLVGLTPARTSANQGRFSIRVEQAAPLCSGDSNTVLFRHLKPLDYNAFRSHPAGKNFEPGVDAQSDEATAIQANYTRVEAALAARETAQLAIP